MTVENAVQIRFEMPTLDNSFSISKIVFSLHFVARVNIFANVALSLVCTLRSMKLAIPEVCLKLRPFVTSALNVTTEIVNSQ